MGVLHLDELRLQEGSGLFWKEGLLQLICLRLSALLSPQEDWDTPLLKCLRIREQKLSRSGKRGPDNGKGDRLGTHITLSQRGFVWAADMTAIYQVHLGPVLLTGDF